MGGIGLLIGDDQVVGDGIDGGVGVEIEIVQIVGMDRDTVDVVDGGEAVDVEMEDVGVERAGAWVSATT